MVHFDYIFVYFSRSSWCLHTLLYLLSFLFLFISRFPSAEASRSPVFPSFFFFFLIVSLNFLSFFLLEAFSRARRYRIFDDRERKGERFADEEAEREEIRDAILKTRTGTTTRSCGEDNIVRVCVCMHVSVYV